MYFMQRAGLKCNYMQSNGASLVIVILDGLCAVVIVTIHIISLFYSQPGSFSFYVQGSRLNFLVASLTGCKTLLM